MSFLCRKHVRLRVRYFISACLLPLENVGQSSVRENALPKKKKNLWAISTSSHWTVCGFFLFVLFFYIMHFLILDICVTLVHCLILTSWQFFCKNRKKARNSNWVEMLLSLFLFSKNPHSYADQRQQRVGHKLYVHLLLIDQSNLVKALSLPHVNMEGPGVWPVTLASQSPVLLFRDSWPVPWLYFLKPEWFHLMSVLYTFVYAAIYKRLHERLCVRGCAHQPI